MDVASAFDAVRAEIFGDAPLQRGASAFSAAAVVRENLKLRCRPCLGHTQCASRNLEVGLRQGGSRTASGWNQLVATLVDERWCGCGPNAIRQWNGLLNGKRTNFWSRPTTFSSSEALLAERRTQEVARVIREKKQHTNQSSLEILPSGATEKDRIPIVLDDNQEVCWVEILLVLGWYLDSTGSTEAQIKGRLSRSGRCSTNFDQCSRDWRFVGFGCCSIGECVECLRETKRAAHSMRCKLGILALWHKALAAIHGWEVHMARKTDHHPRAAAVQCRDAEWRS